MFIYLTTGSQKYPKFSFGVMAIGNLTRNNSLDLGIYQDKFLYFKFHWVSNLFLMSKLNKEVIFIEG